MAKETNAALQALNKALKLEQDGRQFYVQAAERTVDDRGSAMFRSLADDEVLHADIIQRQIDALAAGQGWILPQGVAAVEVDLESPLFPKGQEGLKKAVRPDASDLDALLFGLQIENDTFNLYAEQAQAAQDSNARRMYEYLAAAERTHFNLLMLNYESLSGNTGWTS
jgi:rubrerythrin